MKKIIFLKILLLLSGDLFAEPGAATAAEIAHLLAYVNKSNCQYERNGDFHNAQEAVEHISDKYEYYEDDIKTAEDFIEYSATKSVLSGKYYRIHCPTQQPVKSADWLLDELKRYRQTKAKASTSNK
ncbi:MAG: DUF5329 domain-containing protein [Kangiellaceae bacterium]|jgi:hypothetical protein|nr:DUF5329 domain-containing protein [Kangiellaceae bacterium]